MEKVSFESLRQEDLTLRQREEVAQFEQIVDEQKKKIVEDVKKFIARCRGAGRYISDEEERDSLRAILRYWGTFVYNTSGVYPPVDLADLEIPAPKMRIKFSPVSLIAAGALVLLVGAAASLFALDYLSVRKTPTAIATVQTPVISEPKIGTSGPLKAGEETGISVTVSRAAGFTLTYAWHVEDGEIVRGQGSPTITYRAPNKPGTYLVRVAVNWDDQSVEQAAFIKVELPPTYTPSPTPIETTTPTPQPADTPSPTPTETLTPTSVPLADTPTPTAPGECPFALPFRVPIEGPSVDVEASITSIENCADNLPTASPFPLRGTYSGDMTNKELWILVYAPNTAYYPQSTDACRELPAQFANGQWAETIRLGRAGIPEAFHIVLVVTEIGSLASEDFHSYLRAGCDEGSYDGRVFISPGATELDSIIVHTR